ncbi:MAG: hypothetical protein M3R14_10730 [Acidobacteriota bacterium]|nr:hypothetical protein [Acidobacteriota bacterium]
MNIISSILILIAIVLSFITLLVLIGWLRGGGGTSILLPGLGLIISTPALIVLFLILNIVVVIAAAIIKPRREFVNKTILEQKFEYPNDIFGGCGNGLFDLSIAKDPKNWGQNPNDHHLKICITYDDLDSIHDVFAPGIIKSENSERGVNHEKVVEENRNILQKFALKYPMLGKIEDMYEDYFFTPDEVKKLREECLQLKAAEPDSVADLALRKLIYACDEALKVNSYLMFSSD